jgi:hypothetical protein
VSGSNWTHETWASGVPIHVYQNYGNGNLKRLSEGHSGLPDGEGKFSVQMTVPSSAEAGLVTISALTGGGYTPDAQFTVTGAPLPAVQPPQQAAPAKTVRVTPDPVEAGKTVTISGHGFSPGNSVIITWCFNGPLPEFPIADDVGNFTVTVPLPPNAPTGGTCVDLPSHGKFNFTIAPTTGGQVPDNPGRQGGQQQPDRGNQNGQVPRPQPQLDPTSTSSIALPFSPGETWFVCQGYKGTASHSNAYALDLTVRSGDFGPNACWGDQNASAGRSVTAPEAGNSVPLRAADLICLNLDGGKSMVIGHLANRVTGRVAKGALLGTVANAASANGDYAHIHVQIHPSHGCAGSGPTIPFDDTHGTRFTDSVNLPDKGGANQHQRVALTRP